MPNMAPINGVELFGYLSYPSETHFESSSPRIFLHELSGNFGEQLLNSIPEQEYTLHPFDLVEEDYLAPSDQAFSPEQLVGNNEEGHFPDSFQSQRRDEYDTMSCVSYSRLDEPELELSYNTPLQAPLQQTMELPFLHLTGQAVENPASPPIGNVIASDDVMAAESSQQVARSFSPGGYPNSTNLSNCHWPNNNDIMDIMTRQLSQELTSNTAPERYPVPTNLNNDCCLTHESNIAFTNAPREPSQGLTSNLSPDEYSDLTNPSDYYYLDSDNDINTMNATRELSQEPTSKSPPETYPDFTDLNNYRHLNHDGTWRCAYRGCKSTITFTRNCDFNKHFKYHTKRLLCGFPGCKAKGSFATHRDRNRHERKHNPNVYCTSEGCGKVFSRVDNMKDHVKRKHPQEFS